MRGGDEECGDGIPAEGTEHVGDKEETGRSGEIRMA